MKLTAFMGISFVILLSGCASTMNKDQCLVADWRTVGYQDGSVGRGQEWLGKRADACAEHGVRPDMDRYLAGRDEGLRSSYCRPRNGFDMGRRGSYYGNVCPADMEGEFLMSYNDGKGLYERERYLNQLNREFSSVSAQIDGLEEDIATNTVSLATSAMTDQERIDMALSLKNMAEDRGRLKERLPTIEADLQQAQYDLDAFRASIAPKYPGI